MIIIGDSEAHDKGRRLAPFIMLIKSFQLFSQQQAQLICPDRLTLGEFEHTVIVGVVHEIVNGIVTGLVPLFTAIASKGAPIGRGAFSRRVTYQVT
jgi:hypothetical protein